MINKMKWLININLLGEWVKVRKVICEINIYILWIKYKNRFGFINNRNKKKKKCIIKNGWMCKRIWLNK